MPASLPSSPSPQGEVSLDLLQDIPFQSQHIQGKSQGINIVLEKIS